uniref:Gelsolin-like domain-containing protein n=1 Tax=Glossina morsitans morsitans TaxID=37546 RepID=A0A1B0FGR4_GLOMM
MYGYGSKACHEEAKLIQEIAKEMFNSPWVGGRKPYVTDANYMNYTRLLRSSNEKGYFTVGEKCTDFCQNDLADDDVMILDNGEHVFLWLGSRCIEVEIKLAYKSAQKNLGVDPDEDPKLYIKEHVEDKFVPTTPRLNQVQLVSILDCSTDVFVWFGQKSTGLVRAAAVKLSRELFTIIERPPYAMVIRLQEGTETQIFNCKCLGWDEVMAVDFTRTSVAKTGADLTKRARQQETQADLAALFIPRQQSMPLSEAEQKEDWNYDFKGTEAFVLESKKFVRLPDEELGHFYTGECFVFLCRYSIPLDDDEDAAVEVNDHKLPPENEIECVVYFLQGNNAGLLCSREELEVVRIPQQQQENLKFLSHVKRKFIIRTGSSYILCVPFETERESQSGKLIFGKRYYLFAYGLPPKVI